jgi:predicted membrane channel-forming protein YqfA (hemolysin III family)
MVTVPLYHLPALYEPFAALSYLFGAALFLLLGALLLRRGRGNLLRQIVLAVYAAAWVFKFAMSGVYHMLVRNSSAA